MALDVALLRLRRPFPIAPCPWKNVQLFADGGLMRADPSHAIVANADTFAMTQKRKPMLLLIQHLFPILWGYVSTGLIEGTSDR